MGSQKTADGNRGEADGVVGTLVPAELFELERRTRNVQGLSAGCVVASASIILFVPVEWFVLREHFFLLQSLSLLFLGPLTGTWILLRRRPAWAVRHIDNLVFGLFLFVSFISQVLCWLDTGYDSPYALTLLFGLIGVNIFISWPARRAAAFGLSVYAFFVMPLLLGLVPLGDPKIASLYQGIILGTALILVAFQRHRLVLEEREFFSRLELQRTKATLQKAYEQLQQLDRLKSEFFANVSHELRTPLTLILAPLDELLSKLGPSAERDALKVVRRNADRLLRMIDDLLDLARLEAGGLRLKVMQVDVGELAR
ncbi:MAG: hypothetical protein OER77_06220, partial [Myxococcales bacterium]|nr:hypothetical protein [Myxococcales bacterium]